ncbi:uncharacterized protein LOC113798790 isoform X1 [Dermatophagoides pteronyssinus]|uniref:uncharacterized protein LOC113798790 isoform X1 n=1 Tax=Dermatophagoides pteronyssinus TaxID=6956 RepID=UPI003F66F9BB
MTSDKVNSIKDQSYSTTMSADVPPPPYSSLYPPTSPYGPIPMTSATGAMPTFAPFYHQNGSIGASGHHHPPPPTQPPQMMTPLMATQPSTIGPHHQMYGAIGPNHYIPAAATATQPYGLYQTALIPTAYGPMIAPIQFPPMTNSAAAAAAAAAAAMMIPTTTNTTAGTTDSYYIDPRIQYHPSRAFEIEMARQTIPIPPPFGHIPTIPPSGNMALMYGGGGMPNGNGTMLISKPLKKPFY